MSRFNLEQIPNEEIKKMLLDCIEGSARQEIVLLQPDGLIFDSYEICKFFQELQKLNLYRKNMKKAGKWNTWPGNSP